MIFYATAARVLLHVCVVKAPTGSVPGCLLLPTQPQTKNHEGGVGRQRKPRTMTQGMRP